MTWRSGYRRWFWALTSLATAIAVLLTWFGLDLHAARARVTGHSELTKTRIGAVEYAQLGSGPVVLVLHGAAGGFDQGLEMTAPFATYGYRLIAPSRAGYLRSTMPSTFSVDRQADAYSDLLDHLGLRQAVVVGISAGAWSALAFAARYPDRCRALILIVPASPLPPGVRNNGGIIAAAMFRSDFAAWLGIKVMDTMPGALSRMMLGTNPDVVAHASGAERERLRLLLQHLLPIGARWRGAQFDLETAAHPPELDLKSIRSPVLAISAYDDVYGTERQARRIIRGVADGRVLVYRTGGHSLVGRQEQVFVAVNRFLHATESDHRLP